MLLRESKAWRIQVWLFFAWVAYFFEILIRFIVFRKLVIDFKEILCGRIASNYGDITLNDNDWAFITSEVTTGRRPLGGHKEHRLWWVDIRYYSLNYFKPDCNTNISASVGGAIGCAFECESGGTVIGTNLVVHRFDTGRREKTDCQTWNHGVVLQIRWRLYRCSLEIMVG